MQKSTVHLVAQLKQLLLSYPAMVALFEVKQPTALTELMSWLNRAEELLSSYGLVSAAELAGYRSKLLLPVYHDDYRGSLRKQQLKQAVEMLYPVQSCLQQALLPFEQKLEQSRELARHLLSIIAQSKAVHYDGSGQLDGLVMQLWLLIGQHDQLKSGAVQLRTWLSQQDILLLLAEEINLADFQA
ncbi:hypothetical protein [Rheinheimera sp. WS51]|uniref:hypothetical protein n=1 Tax=Rheinheimera sp. WS51 TaxID=3425886 RepID=UPI003D8C518C